VRLESWQDHEPQGLYDGIISIGAFEHFANLDSSEEQRIESYRAFFKRCNDWLKPGGRLSLQTFAYGSSRRREDVKKTPGTRFLATEIFPETDPPSLGEIVAASAGIFEIEALRNDRKHYAATCREWVKRLKANRERAIQLTDESNVNRYQHYLQLSTVGFEMGFLALFRITLSRI
jgi:cyclopropane-fatty-acyl-phospholipid synthase